MPNFDTEKLAQDILASKPELSREQLATMCACQSWLAVTYYEKADKLEKELEALKNKG